MNILPPPCLSLLDWIPSAGRTAFFLLVDAKQSIGNSSVEAI